MEGDSNDKQLLFREIIASIEDESLREELVKSGPDLAPEFHSEFVHESNLELSEPALVEKQKALANVIRDMSVPQRIKLALFGNQQARALLIRDSNKQVSSVVLTNPRIGESEIFDFAKNTQLDALLLRKIGNNLTWMKGYSVKFALVSNPKTPADVSMKWLKFITDKDLHRLSKSKGIPQVIISQSKKILEQRKG